MNLAPVILFVYNRPWHTEQTLNALALNNLADKSVLYIYCDGPKKDASEEDLKKINEISQLVKSKQWCKEVVVIQRDDNLGLAKNVIDGITTVINKYGRIIVLEDDLITSPQFLTYCNEGLEIYKNASNVYSINGYQFPIDFNISDTFLCPLATSSWGWATWKEKWDCFQHDIEYKDLIQNHNFLMNRFNFANYDFASMINNPKSWAIKWYYSVFIKNGLGLFVTKSLVINIGLDGSGENCGIEDVNQNLSKEIFFIKLEDKINLKRYTQMLDYFTNEKLVKKENNVLRVSLKSKIKRYFQKIKRRIFLNF